MSTTLSTKDLLEFIKDGDNIEERLSNQSDVVRLLLRNLISMKKSFLGSEKKSRDELFDRSAKIILDIKFTALELIDKKNLLKKENEEIKYENSKIKEENRKMKDNLEILHNELNEAKKNYEVILNCNLMLVKSKSLKKVMSLVKKRFLIN
tara:strand:- start:210 stop:662 length:453 start_codon:yes stop_codon:yes gene_type:complete